MWECCRVPRVRGAVLETVGVLNLLVAVCRVDRASGHDWEIREEEAQLV